MNRRNFLKLSLLVLVALYTNLEVSAENLEIISPSETFKELYEEGHKRLIDAYETSQQMMKGYAEGVRADSIPWEEMPERLETIELEWSSENCDPIADLEAVRDWMLNKRGFEDKYKLVAENGRIRYAPS